MKLWRVEFEKRTIKPKLIESIDPDGTVLYKHETGEILRSRTGKYFGWFAEFEDAKKALLDFICLNSIKHQEIIEANGEDFERISNLTIVEALNAS